MSPSSLWLQQWRAEQQIWPPTDRHHRAAHGSHVGAVLGALAGACALCVMLCVPPCFFAHAAFKQNTRVRDMTTLGYQDRPASFASVPLGSRPAFTDLLAPLADALREQGSWKRRWQALFGGYRKTKLDDDPEEDGAAIGVEMDSVERGEERVGGGAGADEGGAGGEEGKGKEKGKEARAGRVSALSSSPSALSSMEMMQLSAADQASARAASQLLAADQSGGRPAFEDVEFSPRN